MKCSSCGNRIKKSDAYLGDESTFYQNKPLCESCYFEDEPCAVIYYNRSEEPRVISGTRNEAEGEFSVEWHSTDPWRGYYETKSKNYSLINTAELLAWHESEEMLKNFDERTRELFDESGIEYARIFARSSNVFFQNYDLYVKKDQELAGRLLVAKAKAEVDYENPKWYRNIVFDEQSLNKLTELFPEEKIETYHDALKLAEKYGDEMIPELQKRLAENK
jgi:hypothetical protein